jgi:hypothetical protein
MLSADTTPEGKYKVCHLELLQLGLIPDDLPMVPPGEQAPEQDQ